MTLEKMKEISHRYISKTVKREWDYWNPEGHLFQVGNKRSDLFFKERIGFAKIAGTDVYFIMFYPVDLLVFQ